MKSILQITSLIILSSLISSCSIVREFITPTSDDLTDMEVELIPRATESSSEAQFAGIPLDEQEIPMGIEQQTPRGSMRTPASTHPQKKTTGNIIYTPLWIKIPISDCIEIVKNHNYKNGACIKRVP